MFLQFPSVSNNRMTVPYMFNIARFFAVAYGGLDFIYSFIYDLSIYLSSYLPIYLSTYLPTYLSTHLPIYLSIFWSIDLSIYLSIYLSIHPSVIYLSTDSCWLCQFVLLVPFACPTRSTSQIDKTMMSKCVTHVGFDKMTWALPGIPVGRLSVEQLASVLSFTISSPCCLSHRTAWMWNNLFRFCSRDCLALLTKKHEKWRLMACRYGDSSFGFLVRSSCAPIRVSTTSAVYGVALNFWFLAIEPGQGILQWSFFWGCARRLRRWFINRRLVDIDTHQIGRPKLRIDPVFEDFPSYKPGFVRDFPVRAPRLRASECCAWLWTGFMAGKLSNAQEVQSIVDASFCSIL